MRLLTPSRLVYLVFFVLVLVAVIQLFSSLNNGYSNSAVDEAKKRMSKRLDRVSQTCKKYNISPDSINNADYSIPHPPAPQYSVLYYQLQKKMVYCPIYKAASTSMLDWLLKMKGVNAFYIMKNSNRQLSQIARDHYPSIDYPAAAELLKDTKRWMVVRHPFERILSAYRDKLENSTIGREHGTLHFFDKYGRKIVSKYRKTSHPERVEPTFPEFVNYLIDTDLALYADDHWIPYYLFCTPCLINYDVIIHFETIEQDVQLLLSLVGERSQPEWKHSNSLGRSQSELVHSYYSQLSRDTLLKLYDKYRIDFELFGYNIDDYLQPT